LHKNFWNWDDGYKKGHCVPHPKLKQKCFIRETSSGAPHGTVGFGCFSAKHRIGSRRHTKHGIQLGFGCLIGMRYYCYMTDW